MASLLLCPVSTPPFSSPLPILLVLQGPLLQEDPLTPLSWHDSCTIGVGRCSMSVDVACPLSLATVSRLAESPFWPSP